MISMEVNILEIIMAVITVMFAVFVCMELEILVDMLVQESKEKIQEIKAEKKYWISKIKKENKKWIKS